jgi:hypothetical protein
MNKDVALRLLKDLNMAIRDSGTLAEDDFLVILRNYIEVV